MKRSSRAAANSAMKRARQRSAGEPSARKWTDGDHPKAKSLNSFERSVLGQSIAISVAFAGFLALLATLWAFRSDIQFREEERKNFRLDRIERAWSRVLRPVTGNTGKGEALSYLFREKVNVSGIDLSCKTMGGMIGNKCVRPITIADLNINKREDMISPPNSTGLSIDEFPSFGNSLSTSVDFSGAIVNRPKVLNTTIKFRLGNARVSSAEILNSVLVVAGEKMATFEASSFVNSKIYLTGKTTIKNSSFSDAQIINDEWLDLDSSTGNSFWIEQPPKCKRTIITKTKIVDGSNPYIYTWENCPFIQNNNNNFLVILTKEQIKSINRQFPMSIGINSAGLPQDTYRVCSFIPTPSENITCINGVSILPFEYAKFLYPDIYK